MIYSQKDLPPTERIRQLASDAYLEAFAHAMVGALGGKVGLAPRLYLKKLVDVLDRIEQFPDSTLVRIMASHLLTPS